ncbi:hypothetical protein A6U87_12895 [Rhizobium sp. AC44/96]|uniref:DUF4118 domain-containing protein n=1 Tax=Rhizobium sp. AC44/96 TaxID=1841654 RepID=UPI00080FDCE8|nr:DUF4118 domain-containing protein [Rhizobium sp. AC44/96]OCJ08138.1 hypothetical protein A6U87_12895 [Rhizobium sp. AC44/96]
MSLDKPFGPPTSSVAEKFATTREMDLSDAPSVIQYLASVIMAAMATAIAAGFDRYQAIPNLSLIYVLPVIVSSVAFGLGPALFSAFLGALAYNFFFTEPRFSLAVADTANIWAIALLFIVGCVTSTIVAAKRHDKGELDRFHRQQEKLGTYAQQMLDATTAEEARALTLSILTSLFQAPAVVLSVGHGDDLAIKSETTLVPAEVDAAREACASQTCVEAGVYPFDQSRFDFWPVRTRSERKTILGVAFDPDRRPAHTDAAMSMIALMLGATIDRHQI